MSARSASLAGGALGLAAAVMVNHRRLVRGWWIYPAAMVAGMVAGAAVGGARSGRDFYTALMLPGNKQRVA